MVVAEGDDLGGFNFVNGAVPCSSLSWRKTAGVVAVLPAPIPLRGPRGVGGFEGGLVGDASGVAFDDDVEAVSQSLRPVVIVTAVPTRTPRPWHTCLVGWVFGLAEARVERVVHADPARLEVEHLATELDRISPRHDDLPIIGARFNFTDRAIPGADQSGTCWPATARPTASPKQNTFTSTPSRFARFPARRRPLSARSSP